MTSKTQMFDMMQRGEDCIVQHVDDDTYRLIEPNRFRR